MAYCTYSEGYRRGGGQGGPQPRQWRPVRRTQRRGNPHLRVGFGARTTSSASRAVPTAWQYTAIGVLRRLAGPAAQYDLGLFYGFYLAANGDEATTQGYRAGAEWLPRRQLALPGGLHLSSTPSWKKDFISPQTGGVVAPARARPCRARRRACSVPESRLHVAGGLGHGPDRAPWTSTTRASRRTSSTRQSLVKTRTYDSFTLLRTRASALAIGRHGGRRCTAATSTDEDGAERRLRAEQLEL